MQRSASHSRFRKSGFAVVLGATAILASAPLKTANASSIFYGGVVNSSAAIGETKTLTIGTKTLFSFTNYTSDKGGGSYLYLTPNTDPGINAKFVALTTSTTTIDGKSNTPITTTSFTLSNGRQLTDNFGIGASIDSTRTYGTDPNIFFSYYAAPNKPVAPAALYVGWQVTIFNADNSSALLGMNYGWAQFSVGTGDTPFTLVDYAFTNGPILTGDAGAGVPEPTSMAIVALGGGLLMRRRRRADTATV